MPEVIFNGPEGRLEGRYHPSKLDNAPVAVVLHNSPEVGGSMNNKVTYALYHTFQRRGFSVLRFNFRGVGRSQGRYDAGAGELSDAASALDWLQTYNPNARECWVGGYAFGAWIGMQLLMRRPEINGFISVAPPANKYDFTFLAPCPASGQIVHGSRDSETPPEPVAKLANKLNQQKSISVDHAVIEGADHAFAELRTHMVALAPRDAELAATARGLLGWHRSHGFCARCGAPSAAERAGWMRRCTACGAAHFPRTDPVAIMLVTRGDHALLGRSPGFPEGMYSLLAGFIEPGETVEAAVRREVAEESGIRVGRVGYMASQPWPFPASLMIGCHAEAVSAEIRVDPTELEDALWITRRELQDVFAHAHPRLSAPRPGAIAEFLLRAWLADRLD